VLREQDPLLFSSSITSTLHRIISNNISSSSSKHTPHTHTHTHAHTHNQVLGEGEAGVRHSPRTVEKVMMRAARTQAADDQAAAVAAAAAAAEGDAAGECGADATRRCLARELLG